MKHYTEIRKALLDMAKKLKNNLLKKEILIPFMVSMVFYFGMYIAFGITTFADSEGYINMDSTREPVYPLFLALARLICPSHGIGFAVVIQNLLMAIAVTLTSVKIKRIFKLKSFMIYVFLGFNFFVALMGQFLSLNACVYSSCILTEGIALQMYLIFFCMLLDAVYSGGIIYEIGMAVLAALMMDTRKHMAIVYIIMLAVLFFARIGKKKFWKSMIVSGVLAILSVALAMGGNKLYNFALRGEFVKNTRDMNLIITTSLYVADREDAELIEDEVARNVFIEVFDVLDSKKANIDYAGYSLDEIIEHYGSSFDVITIDTTLPMLEEDARSRGYTDDLEAEQEADRVSKIIMSSIFMDNLGKYIKVYSASVYNGLVNTIAKRNGIFEAYALVAYIVYIALMILELLSDATRKAGFFGFMVLVGIGVNVMVTAALIFCQPRYMMYNMALFYIAGTVMLYSFIEHRFIKH